MKAKLIKYKQEMFTNYILKNEDGNTIATSRYPFATETEYLAKSKGITLQRLSHENCDEIFGIIDVEKLAEEEYKSHASNEDLYGDSEDLQLAYKAGVVDGFNKAMELNKDKVFTLDDMRKVIEMSRDIKYVTFSIDELIQFFQQSSEIDVEIEMAEYPDLPYYKGPEPKLDSLGCLILKRVV